MGLNQNHRRFKKGDVLTAKDIDQIAETCDWASRIAVEPPLQLVSLSGPLIRLAGAVNQLAYTAAGGITARSGTTAGFGLVYPVTMEVTWSGSTPTCVLVTG